MVLSGPSGMSLSSFRDPRRSLSIVPTARLKYYLPLEKRRGDVSALSRWPDEIENSRERARHERPCSFEKKMKNLIP